MKSIISIFSVAIVLSMVFAVQPWAADDEDLSPLAQKTKAIVDAAYEFALAHSDDMDLVQEALQKDPRFSDHENMLYIYMHCYREDKDEAICCGQGIRPELIGKNMWSLRTPNGRLLFHEIREMIERNGQGWLEYDWLNPFTNTIQTKRSYSRGLVLKDGRRGWVGSGYWKD